MKKNWKDILAVTRQQNRQLATASPDVVKAFGSLASYASQSARLDKKTKELMAVAISIVIRCEGCIAYHTFSAIKAGAKQDEMIETINVAIEMGGGPWSWPHF